MKKPTPLTKENLENFCIRANSMEYTPGIVATICCEFGLDMKKIRLVAGLRKTQKGEKIMSEDNYRYKIVKYFREEHKKPIVVRRGLTLEEAQAHCRDPKTSNMKEGWFDGYTRDT